MRFRPGQHLRRQSDIRAPRERGARADCQTFTVWHLRRNPSASAEPLPRACFVASRVSVGGAVQRNRAMFTAPGSIIAASMLRDIERGAPIEADHIVGDLLRRGGKQSGGFPLLRIAQAHLQTYEARRKREAIKP